MNSVWDEIYREAKKAVESEPILASYLKKTILDCSSLGVALAKRLADKQVLRAAALEALAAGAQSAP